MLNESIDIVVVVDVTVVVVFENIGIQLDSKEIERDEENETEKYIHMYDCLRSNELSIIASFDKNQWFFLLLIFSLSLMCQH